MLMESSTGNNSSVLFALRRCPLKVLILFTAFSCCAAQTLTDEPTPQLSTGVKEITELLHESNVYFERGAYSNAQALAEQARAIDEKYLRTNSPLFSIILNNLAGIHRAKGDYQKAADLFRRSLAIMEAFFGRNDTNITTSLDNLGLAYHDLGKLRDAVSLMKRSLAITEELLGAEHPNLVNTLNNLALAYEDLGFVDEAERLYRRSLDILEKESDHDHPKVATVLNNLGMLYATRYGSGDGIAVALLERSLRIQEHASAEHHPDFAVTLDNLANLQSRQGHLPEAVQLYERSLAIKSDTLGLTHPATALTMIGVAGVYCQLGNTDVGLKLYQRSLDILEQAYGLRHPTVILIIRNIAISLHAQGRIGAAINYFSQALKIQRAYLIDNFVGLADELALQAIENSFPYEEAFHSICALGTRSDVSVAKSLGAEQLALDKALLEEMQALQAALDADPKISTREQRERIRAIPIQSKRLAESNIDRTERETKRQELQTELGALEVRLAQQHELAATIFESRDLTVTEIARSLPPESVLVDFIQYGRYDFDAKTNQWKEQRYAAYLTFPRARDSTNVVVERVDLGGAALINEALGIIAKRFSAKPPQYLAKDLPAAFQRLSDLVYAPLTKHLTNSSHLIICPDGELSRLPFEMLPIGNKFLVEEKTISYVTSGREVVRVAANQSNSKPHTQAAKSLVMGNPDFDFDLASARQSNPAVQLASVTLPLHSLSRDFRGLNFKPLPGAEGEARSVAKLLGTDTTLRLGAEAREAELKAVKSPRVLHLATHGFFLSDQEFQRTNSVAWDSGFTRVGPLKGGSPDDWENPLVRCGIALAGANRTPQITNAIAEDGVLTGLEASLLNLQGTELVILSACDSGTGELKIGEGVMSLRRAFRIAGAETVLASHWSVSDKATSRLMTEFMRRWRAGEPRAQAWREAQLSLLRSKDFSSPYFWAAFTLTGQW